MINPDTPPPYLIVHPVSESRKLHLHGTTENIEDALVACGSDCVIYKRIDLKEQQAEAGKD